MLHEYFTKKCGVLFTKHGPDCTANYDVTHGNVIKPNSSLSIQVCQCDTDIIDFVDLLFDECFENKPSFKLL